MRHIQILIIIFILFIVSGLVLGSDIVTGVDGHEGFESIADVGSGFIVWESNRTGDWRIWKVNLDGTGLTKLSPEEKGRDHYCPHLSPDGKRLVYLSYPKGSDAYKPHSIDLKIPMHLMSTDGEFDRILIESARAYGEDRAVVWIDDDRFIYIDGKGITCEYSISQNLNTPLTSQGSDEFGWLINAQKTFVVPGWPASFNPYNPTTQKITAAQDLGGCQPYFSSDGVWGFWMGRGGGPINRYNLATGKVSPILGKGDGRMPPDRNYLYFPMLSHNRRLFAFAASPRQHDHFNSDYDIFVSQINPQTLEIIGTPVRYTFDPGCDRFPDVYVADLELGAYKGEAPLTVKFAPLDINGKWSWIFGDGTSATGNPQSHKYVKPGEYAIEAKLNNRTLRGRVLVEPAKSPEVVSASLRGDKEIVVTFNEPVDLTSARFNLQSKQKIGQITLSKDKLSAVLQVTNSIIKNDQLHIEGVRDLAQVPNKIPAVVFDIKPHVWPSNRQNLIILWENGKTGCMTGSKEPCKTEAVGRATLDNRYSMRMAGGMYTITGVQDRLLKVCKETKQLTIEVTITADNVNQIGPARIISFSSGPMSRNFTIGQDKDRLVIRLRTPATGENGTEPEVGLCTISAGKPVHLVVSYSPGELICYADGKQVLKTNQVRGDFSNWGMHHLMIGDEWQGQRPWQGTLEGIAIYNRIASATEASRNHESYKALHPRSILPRIQIRATPVSSSPIPALEDIKPYKEALVITEYRVRKVLQGDLKAQKIRVAQWAILGSETVKTRSQSTNNIENLTLVPFELNPQLESIYMSDTLEPNPDIPIYYDLAL
ncbi:MAG: LamG-like jellyroll fold domain-containing protein [Armatimonadota bacterium]